MLRLAIVFLLISIVVGAFGLANVSELTRRISLVLFGLFFLGFLILLAFVLLAAAAVSELSLGTDILMAAAVIPAQRRGGPAPVPAPISIEIG